MTVVKPIKCRIEIISSLIVALLSGFAIASPQQALVQPAWTPPTSRKAKTPFAPKPLHGDNIFKGDGEIWLADAVEKLEGGIFTAIDDRAVNEYVTQVGNNLVLYSVAPKKQYRFIVTTDWTPDAMTAGGARVYISRGMLEQLGSEDELAGVLAHEIAHDAFAHAAKTVTRQMFWMTGKRKVQTSAEVEAALAKLLREYEKEPIAALGENLLGFARFDELEADRAAFYNTYKAGYNPAALDMVLKRLAQQRREETGTAEFSRDQFLMLLFGTHPPEAQRSIALSWESNFVRMPSHESRFHSPAFEDIKLRVTASSKQT
jgi:hypothetical protein